MNDLIYRRLIKITMLNFKNDPLKSEIYKGKLLQTQIQAIDYDTMQLLESAGEAVYGA